MEGRTTAIPSVRAGGRRSYSIEEVMAMLGVCRQTVYKLIERGCFRGVIVDRRYRIIKADFERWLDGSDDGKEG